MLNNDLLFNYLNLEKYLYELYQQNIDNINILLLISLEKEYYEGENLKKIIKDLIKLTNNLTCNFDGKEIKFKVNKVSFDVGDVLNRHNWIYRYNTEYILANNLIDESQIPQNIKEQIEIKAYNTGKQQGKDWFKNHAIPALNYALSLYNSVSSNEITIPNDFQLIDEITTIFEGNESIPKIEYICYEYWLKHPKYKKVEKALFEVMGLENSIIDRSFNHEINFYAEVMKRRGKVEEMSKFSEMFKKYSKIYSTDGAVEQALIQQQSNNNLEFYFGSEPNHLIVFRGKTAQENKIIQQYLENDLLRMNVSNFISIREKNVKN